MSGAAEDIYDGYDSRTPEEKAEDDQAWNSLTPQERAEAIAQAEAIIDIDDR